MSKTYTITSPEGRKYTVTAPDGASREEALRRVKAHYDRQMVGNRPPPRTALQTAGDFAGDVVDNVLPEWGDEIFATLPAAKALVTGGNVAKAFDKGQADFRRAQAQYDRDHPLLSTASTVGGIGASLFLPGGAAVKGASLGAKMLQAGKVGAIYGALAGAGKGRTIDERASHALGYGAITGAMGGAAPLALKAGGALAQQARLRIPGVDRAAAAIASVPTRLTSAVRRASGKRALPSAPPSVRSHPQAHRMIADAISKAPVRGPKAPQAAPMATPAAIADEVERRAAMGVPAIPGDVSAPLTHATGWASRGAGPGQSIVRNAIAARKEQETARLRQHIADSLGPVVDPLAQMETHLARSKAAAAPGYRAAYAEPLVVTPDMERIMGTPAFREALPDAVRNVENAMRDPRSLGFRLADDGSIEGVETLSTEAMDQVIRAMRDNGRAAAGVKPLTGRPINNTNSVHINARAMELKDMLSAQNPAYADVTGRYADDMAIRDAMEQGQDVARLTGSEIDAQGRALPDSTHDAWGIGARAAMAEDVAEYAASHPSGDAASRLRSILGDDAKQDAIGRMGGNSGGVRVLQDRLDAEQQAHQLWREVQRNEPSARRDLMNSMAAQSGETPMPFPSLRGMAGDALARLAGSFAPQYQKDVRNRVGEVLTEKDPATVRAMMDDVAAQADRDAMRDLKVQGMTVAGQKALYALVGPYRDDEE